MESRESEFCGGRVKVTVGDITRQTVDAIVNAANGSLLSGGGADGAIHRAGGGAILSQCQEISRTRFTGGLPTSEAVLTPGGNLSARFVIHTVGPIYGMNGGNDAGLLVACYQNSFRLPAAHDLDSIVFPSISTGAFSYPRHEAAPVASRAIEEFLSHNKKSHEVRLIFFSSGDAEMFIKHQKFKD